MSFNIVIPARYNSQRLPGKLLLDLCGKSILHRVYLQAKQSNANKIVIATDDKRIQDAATEFGADVYMTSIAHTSGTDRIAEVAGQLAWDKNTLVVNVQGDEPLISPSLINQVASALNKTNSDMATLYALADSAITDPHKVKLVTDKQGYALYFSRSTIPYPRNNTNQYAKQHVGIYAYKTKFLQEFVLMQKGILEETESLEQLRVLENGYKIYTEQAVDKHHHGIDTPQDLDNMRSLLTDA